MIKPELIFWNERKTVVLPEVSEFSVKMVPDIVSVHFPNSKLPYLINFANVRFIHEKVVLKNYTLIFILDIAWRIINKMDVKTEIKTPILNWPPHMQRKGGWCGPAITSYGINGLLGTNFTPNDIVEAAGLTGRIEQEGISPTLLVETVKKLAPGVEVITLTGLSICDLRIIARLPSTLVIVDWQGLFCLENYLTEGTEEKDEGHYSIVKDVYERHLKILDPDYKYPIFVTHALFEKRWWDTEEGNRRLAMLFFRREDGDRVREALANLQTTNLQ
jgi:hypothetical protein